MLVFWAMTLLSRSTLYPRVLLADGDWLFSLLVVAPLVALFTAGVAALISTRVSGYRVAYQLNGLIVLPVVLLLIPATAFLFLVTGAALLYVAVAVRRARPGHRRLGEQAVRSRATDGPTLKSERGIRSMLFSSEHDLFRQTVRAYLSREINPRVEEWEAAHAWQAHEVLPGMAALGLLGLEYRPEDGGQGVDHWYTVILGEELGRIPCGGVPMGIAVHTDMATPSLARFGTRELKDQYLAPALRGEMVAAWRSPNPTLARTSRRSGRGPCATATSGSSTARKLYITNGVQADWLCVLARTSDEGGYRGM